MQRLVKRQKFNDFGESSESRRKATPGSLNFGFWKPCPVVFGRETAEGEKGEEG
jgi:hypothetical protein